MKEIKLSVIIIAKNAEGHLRECLESVSFADEIILVDSNSTDSTVALAKQFGAKVIKGIENNFAENRNKGLGYAKGKWVFYIDTDERVSDSLKQNILKAIDSTDSAAYKIQRKNFYLGKNPWPKVEQLERLFLRLNLEGWYGQLHETAKFKGKVRILDGYLFHFTHKDLSSMLEKTISWSKIEAKLRYDANHPKIVMWRLIRVMITGFWDSYISQGGWRAGTMGFIESTYQAYSMFVTYATLWEMQHEKRH